MSMWLPPSEQQRQREVFAERAAHVGAQVEQLQFLETWNRDLKQVDPYLEMVKARDDVSLPELRAGFYHVVRHNPVGQPSVMVVEGPHGEFKEPDSSVFDMLARFDMWSDRTMRERERQARELERARERRRDRERSERVDEALLRLKAYNNPGVMFGGKGWTYRAGARKEKTA